MLPGYAAKLGLLTGVLDLDGATRIGLTTRGRVDLLTRLRPVVEASARDQSG